MSNELTAPNWQRKKLGDLLAKIVGGGTPARDQERFWNGNIPWATVKDLKSSILNATEEAITVEALKSSASNLIPKGTLIIATRMALGKAVFFTKDVAINQDLKALFPKQELESEYLFHWFQSEAGNIEKLGSGSTVKGIRLEVLNGLDILLPPLPEQRRIAEILTTVDEMLANIDAQLAQTQDLKKGLMQRLLTKGIGHTKFKDSPLGVVPQGWEVVRFEECLREKNALSYGILQPGENVADGVPMLRTVDLGENGLAGTTILKVPHELSKQYSKTVLEGGEILFSVMGTLGRTAVVPDSWRGWNVNRALAVIRLNQRADIVFFSQVLKSTDFQAHIIKQSLGSAQMRINLGELRKYWFPLPPLPEQRQIADILSTVDEKLAVLAEKRAHYQTLKQGLMQQLLTGKRRVRVAEAAAVA